MIYESYYWKRYLLRLARELTRRKRQKRWPEASYSGLEMTIMMGFYAIRKLVEAHKISDRIAKKIVRVGRLRRLSKHVDIQNRHFAYELYDFEHPMKDALPLTKICQQLIHSYVFVPGFDDEGRLESIFFNSDFTRNTCLYKISVDTVISLFREIGKNYPSSYRSHRDPKSLDFIVTVGDDADDVASS